MAHKPPKTLELTIDLGPSRDGVGFSCFNDIEANEAITALTRLGVKDIAEVPLAMPGRLVTSLKEYKRMMSSKMRKRKR